jgi:hypothetical protein
MTPRQPTFVGEAAVGFGVSIVAAAIAGAGAFVVDADTALRTAIAAAGLGYLLYRLALGRGRTGRIVTALGWSAAAAALALSHPSFAVYVVAHAALIWLVRSVYRHSSPLGFGADLVLTALGLAVAAWAALRTDSVLLAAWCFLLVQALHVVVPRSAAPRRRDGPIERFAAAHRAAEAALRRLSTTD